MRQCRLCPSLSAFILYAVASVAFFACGHPGAGLRKSPHAARLDAIHALLPPHSVDLDQEWGSDPLVPIMERFWNAFVDGAMPEQGWLDLIDVEDPLSDDYGIGIWVPKPGATTADFSDELNEAADALIAWHEQQLQLSPLLSTGYYGLLGVSKFEKEELELLAAFYPSTHPIWEALLHSAQYVWDTTHNILSPTHSIDIWNQFDALLIAEGRPNGWSEYQRFAPHWEAGLYRMFLHCSWQIQPLMPSLAEREFIARMGREEFDYQQATAMDLLEKYDWENLKADECLAELTSQAAFWKSSGMVNNFQGFFYQPTVDILRRFPNELK